MSDIDFDFESDSDVDDDVVNDSKKEEVESEVEDFNFDSEEEDDDNAILKPVLNSTQKVTKGFYYLFFIYLYINILLLHRIKK